MSGLPEPMLHKVETTGNEVSYNVWLRAKVAGNLADSRSQIPHHEVERQMAERIAALKALRVIA